MLIECTFCLSLLGSGGGRHPATCSVAATFALARRGPPESRTEKENKRTDKIIPFVLHYIHFCPIWRLLRPKVHSTRLGCQPNEQKLFAVLIFAQSKQKQRPRRRLATFVAGVESGGRKLN